MIERNPSRVESCVDTARDQFAGNLRMTHHLRKSDPTLCCIVPTRPSLTHHALRRQAIIRDPRGKEQQI